MRTPSGLRIGTRLLASIGGILLVGPGVVACQSQTGSTPTPTTSATATAKLSTELDHIHGAVVDIADGTILTGTHSGVWRISPDGAVERVGTAEDDFMGLTIARADSWLASGHPGPSSASPNPLGLVESTDHGETWTSVSRLGETDFHALAARGNLVVGSDGHSGLFRSEDGGKTWTNGPAMHVAALALANDRLLAVTTTGLEVSIDKAKTFHPLPGAPIATLLSTNGATAWVIDRSGRAWLSTDAGATWQPRSIVGRNVSGLAAVDATRAYAITTTELTALQ